MNLSLTWKMILHDMSRITYYYLRLADLPNLKIVHCSSNQLFVSHNFVYSYPLLVMNKENNAR